VIFTKRIRLSFAASVHHPSPLVKTDGKPTKRIIRNLRAKCAGGNKTNHPVFPHALPPYDKKRRVSRKNVVRGFSLVRGWHYRTLKGRTRVPLGPVKPTNSYVVARFTAASAMTPPHYVFARHSSAEGCRSNLGGGGLPRTFPALACMKTLPFVKVPGLLVKYKRGCFIYCHKNWAMS